jgi:hypothetical protein
MNLPMIYDFQQVLHTKWSYTTKVEYFSNHNEFTMIYLLPKQELNYKSIYE